MCLKKITKKFGKNDNLVECYKVFIFRNNLFYPLYCRANGYKFGLVYTAKPNLGSLFDYVTGFHAFIDYRDARNHLFLFSNSDICVCRVHIWNLIAEVKDYSAPCIVGRKMRILEILR